MRKFEVDKEGRPPEIWIAATYPRSVLVCVRDGVQTKWVGKKLVVWNGRNVEDNPKASETNVKRIRKRQPRGYK